MSFGRAKRRRVFHTVSSRSAPPENPGRTVVWFTVPGPLPRYH
jgi:hypothetical protein